MWFYNDMTSTTTTTARIESLGKRQRNVLAALARHGSWNGSGWIWKNYSATKTVLDSLIRHGLVEVIDTSTGNDLSGEYRPTRPVEIYFTGGYTVRLGDTAATTEMSAVATEAHAVGRHANSNQFLAFCPTCQTEAAARPLH